MDGLISGIFFIISKYKIDMECCLPVCCSEEMVCGASYNHGKLVSPLRECLHCKHMAGYRKTSRGAIVPIR